MDGIGGNLACIADCLNPQTPGLAEFGGIGRINVTGQRKPVAIIALHDIEHHRPRAAGNGIAQLAQMLGSTGSDTVGKLGQALVRVTAQMHVLDLDIAGRPPVGFQENVDP